MVTCVLRLDEASLAAGRVAGRVEFVATGEVVTVRSAGELHEALTGAITRVRETSEPDRGD
jgi:hypothetical protein